jgi:hypothetical protein
MLSAIAVRAGELLAAAAIAGLVLLAGAAAGVWWLRRRVRRGLQVLGQIVAGPGRRVAAGSASAGARWLLSRPLPDRRWVGGWPGPATAVAGGERGPGCGGAGA